MSIASLINILDIQAEEAKLRAEEAKFRAEEAKVNAKRAEEESDRAEEEAKKAEEAKIRADEINIHSDQEPLMDDIEMSEEEEDLKVPFKDFLFMKMSKRNGDIKDNDEEKEETEETDFVFDFSQPRHKKSEEKSKSASSKTSNTSNTSKTSKTSNTISSSLFSEFKTDFIPISKLKNQKKFVIKGLVQSGKTEYMICLMLYMLTSGKSVVMIVRNIEDDRVQFCKRFEEFKKKYQDHFEDFKDIFLIDNVLKYKKYDERPSIYLLLDNQSNIKKMNEILLKTDVRYVTIFDEADFVDSGNGIKAKYYDILKVRSSKIFWVSATIMDMLLKEEGISGDNIIFLNPSDKKNYKGIINNRIKMITIPSSKYVGSVNDDVFECNPYFYSFLEEYKLKEGFKVSSLRDSRAERINDYYHPRICLVNLSHCIEPLEKAQLKIGMDYPELSVIVYNSPGLVFQKGSKRIRGEDVNCCNVSSFLQYLKDGGEEHTHIIIMSGYMAGRGISFVSEDYKWHLTDEYMVVSKTADEPELIQKVRLQGIYRDDIPLTLYTTEDAQKDLLKASYRIEELSKACKDNLEESKKLLTEIPISKEKFTKRDMTKNVSAKMNKVNHNIGWSLDIYNGEELMSDELLDIHGLEIIEEDRLKFNENKEENKYDNQDNEDTEDNEDNEEDSIKVYKDHISKTAKKKISCFEYIIKYITENNQRNKWILASTFYGEYDFRDVFHLYNVGEKNDEDDKKGKGPHILMKKLGVQNRVWVKYN